MSTSEFEGNKGEIRMLDEFEKPLWEQGYRRLAGIDEVGRGCLFGDVVAAAVILPEGLVLEGIDDSKKLSEKKREALYWEIIDCAEAWAVSRVDSSVVDDINIKQAARLAMKQAVETLGMQPVICWWMPRRWISNCRSRRLSKEMLAASPLRRPRFSRKSRGTGYAATNGMSSIPHTALPYIKATQPSCTGKSFWITVRVRCIGKVFWGSCSRTSRCCSRG